MFKLAKEEISTRNAIQTKLNDAWAEVEKSVGDFNDAVQELRGPVDTAVTKFNEAAAEANEFAANVAARASEEFDNKSENWQESDKGQEASSWKDEYENFTMDELEEGWPDDLDIPQPDIDIEAALPQEAG